MMQADTAEGWMSSFPDHPIFAPGGTPSNGSSFETPESSSSPRLIATILNQNYLVVAHGHELRVTSLSKFKAAAGSRIRNEQEPSFKIFKPMIPTNLPNGPISHLIPNSNSRLLAVCSDFQISVISLPRLDEHPDENVDLECESASVGQGESPQPNYDCPRRVVKVLWHVLSCSASTLLALYSDGIIHEFDISKDSSKPTQVLDLNSPFGILPTCSNDPANMQSEETHTRLVSPRMRPTPSPLRLSCNSGRRRIPSNNTTYETPRRCRDSTGLSHLERNRREGTFSAEDMSASRAVSLCFGSGDGDWGPLTLYGLMENGDLYAICPYLPQNAVLPKTYKSSLLFFLNTKLKSISKSGQHSRQSHDFQNLQTSLCYSLDFLNAIEKLSRAGSERTSNVPRPTSESIDLYGMLKARPLRQGPFLMQPSPIELNTESEEIASDLVHIRYQSLSCTGKPDADPSASSVGVFMIAYQNRIDVHIEVDKIEPCWQPLGADGVSDEPENSFPVLITHETIDLRLPNDIQTSGFTLGLGTSIENQPCVRFARDTRHPDMVFVWHRFGVQAVSMLRWIDPLTCIFQKYSASASSLQADLEQAIEGLGGSDLKWVAKTAPAEPSRMSISTPPMVQCVVMVDDAYLGYGLLIIAENLQASLHPLKHRPVSTLAIRLPTPTRGYGGTYQKASPAGTSVRTRTFLIADGIAPELCLYASLLTKPWSPSPLLTGKTGSQSLFKMIESHDLASADSKTFRLMVEMSQELDRQIQKLIEVANDAQDRLKLQLMEYDRQLTHACSAQDTLARLSQYSPAFQEREVRISRIADSQKTLLERSDSVLQRLTDRANPSLSEGERRWFSELGRMKAEVSGEPGACTSGGLVFGMTKVKAELEFIKESIKKLPEPLRLELTGEKMLGKFGDRQLCDIYKRLVQCTSSLAVVQSQIKELSINLADLSKRCA